jgi:UDP-glucose 4-epimerase
MKILLTGAAGFVGASIARSLAALPDTRLVATDLRDPDARVQAYLAPVAPKITFTRLDVTDRAGVRALVAAQEVTHIVHAAALTPTEVVERERPTLVVDVNLVGTINLLDAAAAHRHVERLLFVSSSGVYGAPPADLAADPGAAQQEAGPLSLGNLYAVTKYSGELLARRYGELCGKPMASVRLAPIYGPLERISEARPRISQVGQLVQALRARRPVKVAGPTVRRDWTYSGDVGDAVTSLLQSAQWRYDVYNVSYGEGLPFRSIVDTFASYGLNAEWTEAVAADVVMLPVQERLPMDTSRLREDTSFVPRFSFAEGLAQLLEAEAQG